MVKFLPPLLVFILTTATFAIGTQRIEEFKNAKVSVWKTIIYPGKPQELKMHHHEQDRVLVAFTDGVLKVKDNKGGSYLLKFKRGQAYYLKADKPGTLHTDENISGNVIKVMIINLE